MQNQVIKILKWVPTLIMLYVVIKVSTFTNFTIFEAFENQNYFAVVFYIVIYYFLGLTVAFAKDNYLYAALFSPLFLGLGTQFLYAIGNNVVLEYSDVLINASAMLTIGSISILIKNK